MRRSSGHAFASERWHPLSAFIHQADACLVTRSWLETTLKRNPQVGKQLKILTSSPELISSVFAFRTAFVSSIKEKMIAAIRELPDSPTDQQVLMIFQSKKVTEQPLSCLGSTLELLATHEELCSALSEVGATYLQSGPLPRAALGKDKK